VFAADGRFLAVVGGRGQGPGEFLGSVNPVPVTRDTVLVVEPAQMRATLFDADLRAARMVRLPGRLGIAVVRSWPQSVFATGMIQSTERFGWPLHVLSFSDAAVEVLSSGGSNQGEGRPNGSGTIAAIAANREFWTNEYTASGYRLTRWDSSLKPEMVLVRNPKGWRRAANGALGSRSSAPDYSLTSIAVDDQGLIWVFVRVPGREWREAWPKLPDGAEIRLDQIDPRKLFATLVEVIDPSTRRVISRRIFDNYLTALPHRRAALPVMSEVGVPTIEIVELSISRR
jgi:hypothetical protein